MTRRCAWTTVTWTSMTTAMTKTEINIRDSEVITHIPTDLDQSPEDLGLVV